MYHAEEKKTQLYNLEERLLSLGDLLLQFAPSWLFH